MKHSLPESANDILIKDGKLLMRSLSVYEILRRFGHILRLTAFRYEDFAAALLADDQSALLSEIHIQLLRTLVREDRQQQTWLGPPDIRDYVNLYLHLIDHSNWPSALYIYLSADYIGNSSILNYLEPPEDGSSCYPFNADLVARLTVLEQLCDQFLLSVLAREEIVNGIAAPDKRDLACRICSKTNGDLISCKNCFANYHLKCSDPTIEDVPPDDDYTCSICRLNQVKGVTDCISEEEKSGNLKRHEALGVDKLGRRYWFIIRRLFVVDETEDDVRYYTNKEQFKEFIDSLNENRFEKSLIENVTAQQEEIERQMQITEDLYATIMKDYKKEDGTYSLFLGQDGAHRSYTNNYPYNIGATVSGKIQPQERDMFRSLNNKFCMTSLNSFKWCGAIDGHHSTMTATIRATILKVETQLPQTFIHPCWQTQRAGWIKSVTAAKAPQDYAKALTRLEISIKPVLYKSAWYNSVGFTHLFRSTFLEREELKKIDRQPRGFERNERSSADFEQSLRLGTMVKFSAKLKPVKHQVWKQKGEEYRLTGLNGWYWQGRTRQSRLRSSPKLYKNDSWRWSSSMNNYPFVVDMIEARIKSQEVIDIATELNIEDEQQRILYRKIPVHSPRVRSRLDKLEGLLKKKMQEIEKQKNDNKLEAQEKKEDSALLTNGISDKTPQVKPVTNGNGQSVDATSQQVTSLKVISTNNNIVVRSDTKPVVSGDGGLNFVAVNKGQQALLNKCAKPKLPPTHDFLTKNGGVLSIFVLPDLELRRLARSAGQKEARTFSYVAKQNYYVWPYGITPRPTIRTCWLYRNELINSMQDVALQLKVLYACIRWDDLQVRPPASGQNTIVTDDATVTIELLKRRDKLPYLTHSEYLIRKITTPNEQPTKYRKVTAAKATPSARSGLRARRQVAVEEDKKPTREELWVSEYQLELWELRQFDEKIERQNALIRERALREEAEKKRRLEEQKRRASAELERRRIKMEQEEAAKKARTSTPIITYQNSKIATSTTPHIPYRPNIINSINIPPQQQIGSQTPTTPVLRYFRTEQGQIIRLPASYLQRGTPLILRHVSPGTNQTNTYIIRPQQTTTTAQSPTVLVKQQQAQNQPLKQPVAQPIAQPLAQLQQQQPNHHPQSEQQLSSQQQMQPTQTPLPTSQPSPTQTLPQQPQPDPQQQNPTQQQQQQQQQSEQTKQPEMQQQNTAEKEKSNESEGADNEPKENSKSANPDELKGQATSVGTVANEMAHDQHAPAPTSVALEARQNQVEGSTE